jgi:hypothetical protein
MLLLEMFMETAASSGVGASVCQLPLGKPHHAKDMV